jgi:hypothetical protein
MIKNKWLDKWSDGALHALFRYLPDIEYDGKQVGRFDLSTWRWSGETAGKPKHLTMEEWYAVCEVLLNKLIDDLVFPSDIHWNTSSYKEIDKLVRAASPGNDLRLRELRNRIRFIAYYEGFMSMLDIVELERRDSIFLSLGHYTRRD